MCKVQQEEAKVIRRRPHRMQAMFLYFTLAKFPPHPTRGWEIGTIQCALGPQESPP